MPPLVPGDTVRRIDTGWMMALSDPGAPMPGREGDWIAAEVPGTAAGVLERAGRWSPSVPTPLHQHDIWFRSTFVTTTPATMRFAGLATLAEIHLDDRLSLTSRSAFLPATIRVPEPGRHTIAIRFASLADHLKSAKGTPARWRPLMIRPGSLRLVRAPLIGHMPGWAPDIDMIGPWLPVTLTEGRAPFRLIDAKIDTQFDESTGSLTVQLSFDRPVEAETWLACAGRTVRLSPTAPDRIEGTLALPGIEPWWPNGLGEPHLHAAALVVGDRTIDLGRVGFRSLTVDRGTDGEGFSLVVNGVPVFCRGASWCPPDPVSPGAEAIEPLLDLARDAGFTMLRLPGTLPPPPENFHRLASERGLLVWHELPFANFDYPTDPDFLALAEAETAAALRRVAHEPSLAVVCGGSEIAQSATMMGLAPEKSAHPLFDTIIPRLVAECAANAVHVPHSPTGGTLPFEPSRGIAHYFGVGAYRRPPDDARRASVRFATECLAFSNLPDEAGLAAAGLLDADQTSWKAGVPRDIGASWDFEDTVDHYLKSLFGLDPQRLRDNDPFRWRLASRAVVSDLIERSYGEWRRAGSTTAGALVWLFNDMKPGAGWGLVDAQGQPKPVWHALRRASRPLHLGITDEGLNGLFFHLVNETPEARDLVLRVAAYGERPAPIVSAERALTVAPRASLSLSFFDLLGRFFDITDAYRFGARVHDATLARLHDAATGAIVAEAVHVIDGAAVVPQDIGLAATPVYAASGPALEITTGLFARFVTLDDHGHRPADTGFYLAPGETRTVAMTPRHPGAHLAGTVAALNGHAVPYGGAT